MVLCVSGCCRQFCASVCDVDEPEPMFNIDQYSDVTCITKPVIYISISEIVEVHKVCFFAIIRLNCFCSASSFAYFYTFLRNELCLSVCLSHSCALLKWFDRLQMPLADTLVWSDDTLCYIELRHLLDFREWQISRLNSQPHDALQMSAKPSVLSCRLVITQSVVLSVHPKLTGENVTELLKMIN